MSGDYCLIRAAYACTRAFLPDRRIPEKLRWSGGATGFFRRCCMQFALVCDMSVVWKRHFKYATNLLVPPPTCKSDFYPAPNLSSAPHPQCRLPVEVAKKSFPLLPRKIRVRLRKKKDTPGSLTCHESRQKQLIFTIKKSIKKKKVKI